MDDNKQFWERFSRHYSGFMRRSQATYQQICKAMRPFLKRDMDVLELACGTGQLSVPLSPCVRSWEATDFSAEMIRQAKKQVHSSRLHFSVQDAIANLGTIKEADLEAVMACEPDVIFIGGRLASSYDALSEIAPVVYLATDTELGVVESVRQNATTIASMFGLEDKVDELMADFDARITALSEFAAGKTAIVGLVTSGSYNVLGNDGRCSMIGREIGFENIGVDANIDTSTHGNEASFEFIVEKAPDYIFVMDRDAAIGTDGAKLAQEIMENELVMGTDAYKNGNIVYLAHPAVWYTAEGGISALDIMLQDLESELLG